MLVVVGKEVAQRPLGARVDRVTNGGDVALGIAGVAEIVVGSGVEYSPLLLDALVLLLLVVVALDDQLVELRGGLKRLGFTPLGPILD